MPGIIPPQIPHWSPGPTTQAELDYADLPILDLSKADTLEGRLALTAQLKDALSTEGLFYVINHGYSKAQTERMFDIADYAFTAVQEEEKKQYLSSMTQSGASYQGYKLREYWHLANGVRDQVEYYNINRVEVGRLHPEPLRPFAPEIEAFVHHNQFNVLQPILKLLALGLEIPEEILLKMHGFDTFSESYVRFQKYFPRAEEDEQKTKNVWLNEHTDFGTITVLYSQPIAALQMLTPDGTWKWVRHIENALVINAGDSLQFLSGGVFKAAMHRVVQPPPDQRSRPRLGMFYFTRPEDDVKLAPLVDKSPLLQRLGIKKEPNDDDALTVAQYWKKRISSAGSTATESKPAEESK